MAIAEASKDIDKVSFISKNMDKNEYNPRSFSFLFKVQNRNFWFKNRRQLIVQILRKYVPNLKDKRMLELGCGCGDVLSFLESNGINCEGADIYLEALKFARKITNKPLYRLDIKKINFKNEFDIIGVFDVLEHIKEDKLVIEKVLKALKPGGFFLLTFPTLPQLWSITDELAFHKRRYVISDLEKLLIEAGFKVLKKSHFIFFLLPIFFISRKRLKKNKYSIKKLREISRKESQLNNTLNNLLYAFCRIEQFLIINLNINLPCGSSGFLLVKAPNKKILK